MKDFEKTMSALEAELEIVREKWIKANNNKRYIFLCCIALWVAFIAGYFISGNEYEVWQIAAGILLPVIISAFAILRENAIKKEHNQLIDKKQKLIAEQKEAEEKALKAKQAAEEKKKKEELAKIYLEPLKQFDITTAEGINQAKDYIESRFQTISPEDRELVAEVKFNQVVAMLGNRYYARKDFKGNLECLEKIAEGTTYALYTLIIFQNYDSDLSIIKNGLKQITSGYYTWSLNGTTYTYAPESVNLSFLDAIKQARSDYIQLSKATNYKLGNKFEKFEAISVYDAFQMMWYYALGTLEYELTFSLWVDLDIYCLTKDKYAYQQFFHFQKIFDYYTSYRIKGSEKIYPHPISLAAEVIFWATFEGGRHFDEEKMDDFLSNIHAIADHKIDAFLLEDLAAVLSLTKDRYIDLEMVALGRTGLPEHLDARYQNLIQKKYNN